MSLTTTSTQSCILDSINGSHNGSHIEATLYTAFYYPKTQADAVKLIYGIDDSRISIFGADHERAHKSTSNININPITKARKKLLAEGFLIKMDNNLRNSNFKATSEPITNFIKNKLKLRKSRRSPNPSQDFDALSIILDSKWFRSFFSNDFLLKPPTHSHIHFPDEGDERDWRPQVYHPFEYISKEIMEENMMKYPKLTVYDVTNLFTYLIEDIGAYCWGIVPVLKTLHSFTPINSQEIIQVGNFDNIINKYRDTLPTEAIRDFYSYCSEEGNTLEWDAPTNPSRFIQKITVQSALIPLNISEIMVRSGRSPLTLMIEIQNLQKHLGLYSR